MCSAWSWIVMTRFQVLYIVAYLILNYCDRTACCKVVTECNSLYTTQYHAIRVWIVIYCYNQTKADLTLTYLIQESTLFLFPWYVPIYPALTSLPTYYEGLFQITKYVLRQKCIILHKDLIYYELYAFLHNAF